jgi:hypothetical protein
MWRFTCRCRCKSPGETETELENLVKAYQDAKVSDYLAKNNLQDETQLTQAQKKEIRTKAAEGYTRRGRELAGEFGISGRKG